jgi:pilus assembly protein Flp/PilA
MVLSMTPGRRRMHELRWAVRSWIRRVAKDDSAATAIEYALIASLVSIVIVTAVTLIGATVESMFNSVATAVD